MMDRNNLLSLIFFAFPSLELGKLYLPLENQHFFNQRKDFSYGEFEKTKREFYDSRKAYDKKVKYNPKNEKRFQYQPIY